MDLLLYFTQSGFKSEIQRQIYIVFSTEGDIFFQPVLILCDSQKLNKDTTITAASGKQYPAAKVFSHALRYFKDHTLQELSDQSATEIINEDIRWVLTVPAIWKAPAKQFMRHAAYEASHVTHFYITIRADV